MKEQSPSLSAHQVNLSIGSQLVAIWHHPTNIEDGVLWRLQANLEHLAGWSLRRDISISFATMRVLVDHRAY